MEIERKYLLASQPDNLENYPCVEIEQAYLCESPTLRVRRVGDSFVLTVKEHLSAIGGAIHNREEEFELSEESYRMLRQKCDGGCVAKTRYSVDLEQCTGNSCYKGLVAEVDVFHQGNEGLVLVEVEFPTTESANLFIPPVWFGPEVSDNPRYRNSNLIK
ncbi:MAG: CYTH domain-containing protein [Bacteroidales bacterium]|nr:CYTH domain-containing protein [Candidatus Colimorpha onthohippi]